MEISEVVIIFSASCTKTGITEIICLITTLA